jgi:hypothetical protein
MHPKGVPAVSKSKVGRRVVCVPRRGHASRRLNPCSGLSPVGDSAQQCGTGDVQNALSRLTSRERAEGGPGRSWVVGVVSRGQSDPFIQLERRIARPQCFKRGTQHDDDCWSLLSAGH